MPPWLGEDETYRWRASGNRPPRPALVQRYSPSCIGSEENSRSAPLRSSETRTRTPMLHWVRIAGLSAVLAAGVSAYGEPASVRSPSDRLSQAGVDVTSPACLSET